MSSVFTEVLRNPRRMAERCRSADDLREVMWVALAAIVVGGALFGAAMGASRGGIQIVFAAIKVPLALVATLGVCVPAFHAIAAALGRPWPLRTVVAITLAAATRASLVLLALAPVLWLAVAGASYHAVVLGASIVYAIAGLTALSVLGHGLGDGPGKVLTILAIGAVFCFVGSQTAWRPRRARLRRYGRLPARRRADGRVRVVADAVSLGEPFGRAVRRAVRREPELRERRHARDAHGVVREDSPARRSMVRVEPRRRARRLRGDPTSRRGARLAHREVGHLPGHRHPRQCGALRVGL